MRIAASLYASLIGFPDYGNTTDITSDVTSSAGYTVQSNGWLDAIALQTNSSTGIRLEVHINGFVYIPSNTWNSVARLEAFMPVSVGDNIKIIYYGSSCSATFVPCK